MTEQSETKEWVRVGRQANGTVSVTVTLQRDNVVVKWAVKAYSSTLPEGLKEARDGATKALAEMEQALAVVPA